MKFELKLFTCLSVGFIIATVIGTLTHELGHYLVAGSLGYDASISYGATRFHHQAISSSDRFWIILGGPLETMLTGSLGLAMILISRERFQTSQKLSFSKWVLIFIALFWLRQLCNFFFGMVGLIKNGRFPTKGDEQKLDRYFHLPGGTCITISAIFATAILILVIFNFIPKQQRLTFVLSGNVGGLAGYYLWLHSFGKIVMP
jgi:hypothetical protein